MMRSGGRRLARQQPSPPGPDSAVGEHSGKRGPATHVGQRLGALLIERGLITSAQLSDALLRQVTARKRLGAVLVDSGALTEHMLTEVLAHQLRLPFVDLERERADDDVLGALPGEIVQSGVLPLHEADGRLVVAVSDPTNHDLDEISRAAEKPVSVVLAPAGDIRRAIDALYPVAATNGSAAFSTSAPGRQPAARTISGMDRHVTAFTSSARRPEAAQIDEATEAPIVQAVNLLITQALDDRASDIHIEPQQSEVRVRYRIDGVLHNMLTMPASMASPILSRIKVMADMNIVERRRPQDGQITTDLNGRSVDIRVATTPTIWGEKAALRVLDRSRSLFNLGELGMSDSTYRQYVRMLRSPIGMVVSAGPSGSGKTTTLYSTLGEIDSVARNVTTIEDPVEYVFPSINQIPINEQAGITFASGLRSILRQDPDVILVGEIRDTETAQIAVQSALTGHFVLSSLHAQDAVSALHRFLDMGIEAFLVASSVVGVVAQRLLRRTCDHCREPYQPPVEELAFYDQLGGQPKTEFSRGGGCDVCAHTGYESRVGVFELLHVTDDIRQVLVDQGSQKNLRDVAVANGMTTLQNESVRLVAEDVTTIAEVARMVFSV